MKPLYNLTNQAGLFYPMRYTSIMDVDDIVLLQHKNFLSNCTKEEQEIIQHVCTLLKQLPQKEHHRYDHQTGVSTIKNTYGVYLPDRVSAKSAPSECGSAIEAGWDTLRKMAPLYPKFHAILLRESTQIIHNHYRIPPFKKIPPLLKKLEARFFYFKEVDPFLNLSESISYAVFRSGGLTEGYLDESDFVGPLGRARMYESESAALKHLNARGFNPNNFHIVEVSLSIRKIVNEVTPSQILTQVFSLSEEKTLTQLMERLGIEKMKEKLTEFESANPPGNPEPTNTRKRI